MWDRRCYRFHCKDGKTVTKRGEVSCPGHTGKKWPCQSLSRAQLLASPWTVARQAPLSMGFSRQEYYTG